MSAAAISLALAALATNTATAATTDDASDMFMEIAAEADIVGLGESVHATSGYAAERNALTRRLIEEAGFTLVLLETPRLRAMPATRYVDAQSPREWAAAWPTFYRVWQSTEIAYFLEWTRRHNAAVAKRGGQRVVFMGYDIREAHLARRVLEQRAGSSVHVDLALEAVDTCKIPATDDEEDAFERAAWAGALEQVKSSAVALWDCSEAFGRARAGVTDPELYLAITTLKAWTGMLAKGAGADPRSGDEQRDAGLADSVRAIRAMLGNPKTVIWAHNWHVAKSMDEVSFSETALRGRTMLGNRLKRELGDKYLAIGLIAHEVATCFSGQKGPLSFSEPAGSLEDRLRAMGKKRVLVTALPTGERMRFSTMFREDGPEGEAITATGEPLAAFDALWFVDAVGAQRYPQGTRCD